MAEENQIPEPQAVILPEIPARDAVIHVTMDKDRMKAEMLIDAPEGEGKPATIADIYAALRKENVVYGLDEAALASLGTPLYGQTVVVAVGTPAQNGVDGSYEEIFPQQIEKKFAQRKDGTLNFKELGLIRDVPAGTTICNITLPTPGVEGKNILGQVLKAREGRRVLAPAGEGVHLTEDGLRLVAVNSGHLVFRAGRWCVDKVYSVTDIDLDVGNITFSGDVVVNGNMLDGFEIHAGGNVTLRGEVGAVLVVAGGNISVERGINGMSRAVLEAGKEVKAGFIENCTVRATEKIHASSVINSFVECEGVVEVTQGKGIICGGKITSFGSVTANEVGNASNTLTTIVLGVTPKLLKERKELNEKLEDVTKHIEEMLKNINYIQRLVADGRPIPPERKQILQRTQIQLPMSEKKQAQLQQAIADLEDKMQNVNAATLTARILHPPIKISIGALSTNCLETKERCRVYKNSEGELVFGTY